MTNSLAPLIASMPLLLVSPLTTQAARAYTPPGVAVNPTWPVTAPPSAPNPAAPVVPGQAQAGEQTGTAPDGYEWDSGEDDSDLDEDSEEAD